MMFSLCLPNILRLLFVLSVEVFQHFKLNQVLHIKIRLSSSFTRGAYGLGSVFVRSVVLLELQKTEGL